MSLLKYKVKNIRKIVICFLLAFITMPANYVHAKDIQEISFHTEYSVCETADGLFIVQDQEGKYGLLDSNGKMRISCKYDAMNFPKDVITYDYLLVKEGSNWGVLDYKGAEIIPVQYNSIDEYKDGRMVAAAYNGNTTDIYNDKGSQIGKLHGEFKVLSDNIFKSSDELRSLKDKTILSYDEEKLYFIKKGTDVQVANTYAMGKYIVADYNVGSGKDRSKDAKFGKISTYRYIRVYDTAGNLVDNITPDPDWTKNEQNEIRGAIRTEKIVSDHSLIVRMMGYKQDYLAVYDFDQKTFSEFYKNISDFYDGKAFAADENGELFIIDENGNKKTKHALGINDYERLGISTYRHDPFAIFKKKGKNVQYKLYSLCNNIFVDNVFSTVTYMRNSKNEEICKGLPLVSNENKEYTILDRNGNPFFEYGKYEKKLVARNALYSLNCVCIVEEKDNGYDVHAYYTGEGERHGFLDSPVLLAILVGCVILLLILLIIAYVLKQRSDEKMKEIVAKERKKIMESQAYKHRMLNPHIPTDNEEEVSQEEEKDGVILEEDSEEELEQEDPVTEMAGEDVGALLRGDTIRLPDLDESTFYVKDHYHEEDIPSLFEKDESDELLTEDDFFGKIICVEGAYVGAEIALCKDEWIRIGRDEAENDLVMPSKKVSRKHCAISYDTKSKQYLVIDYSRNGVYTDRGQKLKQGSQNMVSEGTKLFLGNKETVIRLAKKTRKRK